MKKTLKPFTTYEAQLDRLENRGLIIDNRSEAIDILERINYYRLSGYFYHKQNPDDSFQEGTTFQDIFNIYEFDRELRALTHGFLEHIEIHLRTTIAHVVTSINGPGAHYVKTTFADDGAFDSFITRFQDRCAQNKDTLFVKHHRTHYGGAMPLWVAVEIMTFSDISLLFASLNDGLKDNVATCYGHDKRWLQNWFHGLSVLRNICSHYGRIYNRIINPPARVKNIIKKRAKQEHISIGNKYFGFFIAMLSIMSTDESRVLFSNVGNLIADYKESIDIGLLGFPKCWESIVLNHVIKS